MPRHTRGLSRFANGHTQIIAAIPDGDAQDRQDAAHFVSEQGHPGRLKQSCAIQQAFFRDAETRPDVWHRHAISALTTILGRAESLRILCTARGRRGFSASRRGRRARYPGRPRKHECHEQRANLELISV